jgi:lipopolysaccharide transport system ATP-binding protein
MSESPISSDNQKYAIKTQELGKSYQMYRKPSDRLMQILRPSKKYFKEFWAIRNISFEVEKGETVGIIGRNGSGKSTLLQIICGTLDQTEGEVELSGKVAALLELGAGFNPDFTGIDNIYFSSALYGMSRAMVDARLTNIIEFADIGDHLNQPVKTYSSGMFVRLAFAVIAHVDAKILVIDEALSVGDIFFQQKCLRFLHEFQDQGGTILFVSHDMAAVSALCTRCLLLKKKENGEHESYFGDAKDITNQYLQDFYASREPEKVTKIDEWEKPLTNLSSIKEDRLSNSVSFSFSEIPSALFSITNFNGGKGGFGTGLGQITDVYVTDINEHRLQDWESSDFVRLVISGVALKDMTLPAIAFLIKNRNGQVVFSESMANYFTSYGIKLGKNEEFLAAFRFSLPRLLRGNYVIDIAFAEGTTENHVQHHWIHEALLMTVMESSLVQGIFAPSDISIDFKIINKNQEN